jgi:hypothetical protein
LYGVNQDPICETFTTLGSVLRIGIDTGISIFIVVINVVLTKITVILIQWVGYDNHS